MLNFRCHFLLALTVFTTATIAEKQICNVADKTNSLVCRVYDDLLTQDDGKFSKVLCGCGRAIINRNFVYCEAKDYDFSPAPRCGELLQSEEFEKSVTGHNQLFRKFVVEVLFKRVFDVCDGEDEATLENATKAVLQPGPISTVLLGVVEGAYKKSKLAGLYAKCYKELLQLAAESKN